MSETPREYKKRIDEKWKRNEKNKERLIKKIEGYELLDKGFKEQTKKEILANFEKNQKADLEGEQYKMIVSELGKIDKKYEELENLKGQLEIKKEEKFHVEVETRESKIDGADETTLNLQISGVRKLKDKLKSLQSEIEELENDIKNREQEIKEIEESYGEKFESIDIIENSIDDDNKIENQNEQKSAKPETLKEFHEQTIKELWSKDKTRKDIIKLLESGTGIDDELSEKIKKEIFDRFFEYYDEKQGDLKMKSARHLKNKLRNRDKMLDELNCMQEGRIKEEKILEFEKMERLYGVKTQNYNVPGLVKPETIGSLKASKGENKEGQSIDGLTIVEEYGEIGGYPIFKAKDKNGYYRVVRGNAFCGDKYIKIFDVGEIGGYPIFKAKDKNGYYSVVRGVDCRNNFKQVGEIGNIGGKPIYKGIRGYGEEYAMRGYTICGGGSFKKIYEIKACEGKPIFIAKTNSYDDNYKAYRGDKQCCSHGDKIEIVGEIGGKPIFKMKDKCGYYRVVRGDCYCAERERKILNIQNIGGKPFFLARNNELRYTAFRGYEKSETFYDIKDIKEEGNKPVFTAERYGEYYIVEGTQIMDEELYRERWENSVMKISTESKEKIMDAVEEIPVNIQIDKDGSKIIEFKLGRKTYRVLNPNLKNHLDKNFDFGGNASLQGMRGDYVDKWENKKLKKYVKEKQSEGFHIPDIEEIKALLQELGEKADINDEQEQIAMLMYITGLDGLYWLSMGDRNSSGNRGARSQLYCTYSDGRYFDCAYENDIANLCMISCKDNE